MKTYKYKLILNINKYYVHTEKLLFVVLFLLMYIVLHSSTSIIIPW